MLKHPKHFMFLMDTQIFSGIVISLIDNNRYTICSGSYDNTIRIWDIETTKQFIIFKGNENALQSVKYEPNELGINGGSNTILSGSNDRSIRLWDQVFNGYTIEVWSAEYSLFVVNNMKFSVSPNVICSGSVDNTIRFWDIRSNNDELYIIKGNTKEDSGILCLKFLLKKKEKSTIKRQIVVLIYIMVQEKVLFEFGDKF
ncbi:WD-40 repeat protein [Reticulomyxa filosa]|uniref:WD-40 repeat protein n=1 Tax=Reticulomyxa filosa TaxID=46433 RepID=X6LWH6_RETFI|nr:WD-40 repeat protein [Reticulomyxa filosa]|eukprot:ETO05726.1 WD-40 repeat protein [Reticulomyxa filosa]